MAPPSKRKFAWFKQTPMKKITSTKIDNSTGSNLQTRQNQLLFDVFQNPLWKDWYPNINQVQHAIVLTASPRTEEKRNTLSMKPLFH